MGVITVMIVGEGRLIITVGLGRVGDDIYGVCVGRGYVQGIGGGSVFFFFVKF